MSRVGLSALHVAARWVSAPRTTPQLSAALPVRYFASLLSSSALPVVYGFECAAFGKSLFFCLFDGAAFCSSSTGSLFSTLGSLASAEATGLGTGTETGRGARRGALCSTDRLCRSTTSGALAAGAGASGAAWFGAGVPGSV